MVVIGAGVWFAVQGLSAAGLLPAKPTVVVIPAHQWRSAQRSAAPAALSDAVTTAAVPQGWIDQRLMLEEAIARGLHREDPVSRRLLLDSMHRLHGQGSAVPEARLLRQAEALDLVRQDVVVRRHLIARMEARLADESASYDAEDFEAFLARHAQRFAQPEQVAIDQRQYVSRRAAQAALEALAPGRVAKAGGFSEAPRGDASLLADRLPLLHRRDLQRLFGEDVARAVWELPEGVWQGPVRSPHGWHLLRVRQREAAGAPTAEARRQAAYAWRQARRQAALEAGLASLRQRYRVVLEPAGRAARSSGVAGKADESGLAALGATAGAWR